MLYFTASRETGGKIPLAGSVSRVRNLPNVWDRPAYTCAYLTRFQALGFLTKESVMEMSKNVKAAAERIAARAGVSVEEVVAAYRAAAAGRPVNMKSLYLA